MHEVAICRALVEQLEAVARDNGAARVTGLTLRIGPLSGVVPELLASAFPVAAAGSLAEGARLSIDTAPLRIWCPDCKLECEAEINRLACVRCGTWRTELRSGDELLLSSVVVEDDPPAREPREEAHV